MLSGCVGYLLSGRLHCDCGSAGVQAPRVQSRPQNSAINPVEVRGSPILIWEFASAFLSATHTTSKVCIPWQDWCADVLAGLATAVRHLLPALFNATLDSLDRARIREQSMRCCGRKVVSKPTHKAEQPAWPTWATQGHDVQRMRRLPGLPASRQAWAGGDWRADRQKVISGSTTVSPNP